MNGMFICHSITKFSYLRNLIIMHYSKKHIYITILAACGILFSSVSSAQQLAGTVKDKTTGESLPGVTLFIPDLKSGVVSDENGHYIFYNLPKGKFILQVRLIGYGTLSQTVDLTSVRELNFEMSPSIIEKSEVVVTGSAFTTDNKRSSVPVTPVDKMQILTAGGENLISSLAEVPGVSTVSTGNGISKPVIRGLSYNRVVVVNEGVRQEGQQWGDEHGIEIDQYSADKIEVLKGPSSLLYGSDALGGVINILEPIPPPPGAIRGEAAMQYGTNSGLTSNSLMLEGNQKGYTWRVRGTYKNAGSYKTPVERVYNSGFNEFNTDALLGLHKKWGFSHLHLSRWDSHLGLTEGDRDSLTNKFLDQSGNVVPEAELNTRKLVPPEQHILHTKISSVNNIIIGQSQLRVNLGWQANDRKEFPDISPDPGLWFSLQTMTYDVKYYLTEKNGWETAFGFSGMHQENQNKGSEFLIPAYTLNDAGAFATVKRSWTKTTVNAGLRYDWRGIDGKEQVEEGYQLFSPLHENFKAFSGSVGATYQVSEKVSLKTNLGRGFRAPNISELSANGVHEGTFRYELGNKDLQPETSLQADAGLSVDNRKYSFGIDLFYNRINHFIYYRNLNQEERDVDGIFYPVYTYVQGLSDLFGGELNFDFHPLDRLHFESSLSYVQGENRDLNTPLPFIPPLKITNELKYIFRLPKASRLKGTYLSVKVDSYFSQNRIDAFETSTPGYVLVHLKAGTQCKIGRQEMTLFINGSNLLNKTYFDNMSRLKEIGVNGMGRSIDFGALIPFGLKKS